MHILWVTRSFLDYRIPVFQALDELVDGSLTLLFSGDYVPQRVTAKAAAALGDRAIPLTGEWKLGREDRGFMANRNVSIRWQPGLGRRIRELQPDVIVTDGFFKWALPCLLHRIRRGTPLVICYERTAHTERTAQGFRKLYRRWAVRHTDAMCCNGRLCGEYTQSLGMPADRITYGHMAADTEGLAERARSAEVGARSRELRKELGVGMDGRLFLYAGRLVECKGLRELLNAWQAFQENPNPPVDGHLDVAATLRGAELALPNPAGPGTTARLQQMCSKHCGQECCPHVKGQLRTSAALCLVGDGPLRRELEELSQSRGIRNVRFAGAVDYDEMTPYYAAADAFVMPTLEDNWSLVVPEAMACGLPVLCSKYNGCWPELVHEGVNGWVFDPLDEADTLRALRVAADPATDLAAMGKKSREIVADHTPQKAAESILAACHIATRHRNGGGGNAERLKCRNVVETLRSYGKRSRAEKLKS